MNDNPPVVRANVGSLRPSDLRRQVDDRHAPIRERSDPTSAVESGSSSTIPVYAIWCAIAQSVCSFGPDSGDLATGAVSRRTRKCAAAESGCVSEARERAICYVRVGGTSLLVAIKRYYSHVRKTDAMGFSA